MAVNAASRATMAAVGLPQVRTFHREFDDPLPGTELGEVEYAITREEWLARRGRSATTGTRGPAPVFLQACLNGPRRPAAGLRLPVTPAELSAAAVAAVDAGADGLHLHPKDATGGKMLEPAAVGAAVGAVRRALPGVQVGVTTGAWAVPDAAHRARLVAAWRDLDDRPHVASVNWHEDGAPELAALLLASGIGVEAGLWTPPAARAFRAWPRAGRSPGCWSSPPWTTPARPPPTPRRSLPSRAWSTRAPGRRCTARVPGRGPCSAGRPRRATPSGSAWRTCHGCAAGDPAASNA